MIAPIWVVEDDAELGETMREILNMMTDSEVEWIRDGQEALERLESVSPLVVILDMHMPHVSGLEVLDYIRHDNRLTDTKVVVVTADAMRTKEAEDTADLVLVKPVSYVDLSQLVMRMTQ